MAIEVKPPTGFYAEFTIPDYFHGTWWARARRRPILRAEG
jgi:hypothetical protein